MPVIDFYGKSVVGSITSGLNVDLGTPQDLDTYAFSTSTVVDTSNERVVVVYYNNDYIFAKVGEVDSSTKTITYGLPVGICDGSSDDKISTTYDSTNNKIIIVLYRYSINSGVVYVGQVNPNDNSLTIGPPTIFYNGTNCLPTVTYNSINNKIVIAYRDQNNGGKGTVITGSVSGDTFVIDSEPPVIFETGEAQYIDLVHNTSSNAIVISYRDVDNSEKGTSVVLTPSSVSSNKDTFIGIAQNSATNGQRVPVKIQYAVDNNQSGLIPGAKYYVNDNGQLTTVSTNNVLVGTAISNTEIMIDNRVDKNQDNMHGFLTLHNDPQTPMHAATKQYVDMSLVGTAKTFNMNVWTKAQSGAFTTLYSNNNSLYINMQSSNNFVHTLTENTTLSTPINPTPGQSGMIEFNQGSTPRTLSFSSFWKFVGGNAPSLTNTANAKDVLIYVVNAAGTSATCTMLNDVK